LTTAPSISKLKMLEIEGAVVNYTPSLFD